MQIKEHGNAIKVKEANVISSLISQKLYHDFKVFSVNASENDLSHLSDFTSLSIRKIIINQWF